MMSASARRFSFELLGAEGRIQHQVGEQVEADLGIAGREFAAHQRRIGGRCGVDRPSDELDLLEELAGGTTPGSLFRSRETREAVPSLPAGSEAAPDFTMSWSCTSGMALRCRTTTTRPFLRIVFVGTGMRTRFAAAPAGGTGAGAAPEPGRQGRQSEDERETVARSAEVHGRTSPPASDGTSVTTVRLSGRRYRAATLRMSALVTAS